MFFVLHLFNYTTISPVAITRHFGQSEATNFNDLSIEYLVTHRDRFLCALGLDNQLFLVYLTALFNMHYIFQIKIIVKNGHSINWRCNCITA